MTALLPSRRLTPFTMGPLAKADGGLQTISGAFGQRAELMKPFSDTVGRFATVRRLCDAVQRNTDHVIACAHAARQLGATAESYRSSALELYRQADRAERLLFGQAVTTFRAAAAECLLIADALEITECKKRL